MKLQEYVIDIKEADPNDEYFKDNWYAVFPNHYYKKIFKNSVKKTGCLPWKKQIIRIYSSETKKSIYRIFKGAFRASSKTKEGIPIIRISSDAARVLKSGEINKKPVSLQLSKGSKLMFYWNHFDASIRCGYKLGFVALAVSLIGLFISGISLYLAFR